MKSIYRKLDWNSFVYFMLNEKNCRESSKQQQNFFVISRCAAAYFIIKAVRKDLKKKKLTGWWMSWKLLWTVWRNRSFFLFFFFFLSEITLVRCTHLISDTSTTYSCVNNVFWQFPWSFLYRCLEYAPCLAI